MNAFVLKSAWLHDKRKGIWDDIPSASASLCTSRNIALIAPPNGTILRRFQETHSHFLLLFKIKLVSFAAQLLDGDRERLIWRE